MSDSSALHYTGIFECFQYKSGQDFEHLLNISRINMNKRKYIWKSNDFTTKPEKNIDCTAIDILIQWLGLVYFKDKKQVLYFTLEINENKTETWEPMVDTETKSFFLLLWSRR